MRTTLNEMILFDELQLVVEAESINRAKTERAIPGLDGTLSIDLGERDRKIRQKGRLRAGSQVELKQKIEKITAFMDGKSHTLKTSDGREFKNLRMDSFKITENFISGCDVGVHYQIEYRQLKV